MQWKHETNTLCVLCFFFFSFTTVLAHVIGRKGNELPVASPAADGRIIDGVLCARFGAPLLFSSPRTWTKTKVACNQSSPDRKHDPKERRNTAATVRTRSMDVRDISCISTVLMRKHDADQFFSGWHPTDSAFPFLNSAAILGLNHFICGQKVTDSDNGEIKVI